MAENEALYFGGGVLGSGYGVIGNTIVGNSASQDGTGIFVNGTPGRVANNLIAGNHGTSFSSAFGLYCATIDKVSRIECNNVWGNPGGNYSIANCDTTGGNNLSVDPQFCEGSYTLAEGSPCSAEVNTACGQIGAYGVECSLAPVQATSWGRIKAGWEALRPR